MVERKFYSEIGHYGNNLKPGESFTLIRKISFNSWGGEIGPVVERGMTALIKERENSIAKEKEIYEKLNALGAEWVEQAAQTLLIDKALEYLEIPEVKHTSNTWVANRDGSHEISNRVYKMKYLVSPDSKLKPGMWFASWGVAYNVQEKIRKNLPSESYTIAIQQKKRYPDEAAANRYIQGRIDAYAHYFTELSPPVPEKEKFLFSYNGYLLPGYTMTPRPPTPDELLDFIDDHDVGGAAIVEEPPPVKEAVKGQAKPKPKRGKAR